jgi:alkylation response protein AidB-like acyl-CoA dehydrogenase
MHFARTEEQDLLAGTVRDLLRKRADSAAVRVAMESDLGYDDTLWRALCEQVGVAALAVPEEHGGFGASLVETAIVLEELGHNLAPTPLLAIALETARLLLGGGDSEALPSLAAGEVKPFSLGPLVLEPGSRVETLDPTLRLAAGAGDAPDAELLDVAAALVSALHVGTMQRALDMTVAYSKERHQFGRPIGSFQALKHRMADMLVLVEASRSASWAATAAAASYVGEPGEQTSTTLADRARVARRYVSDASLQVASEMIQLHGGIAITWEHDAHLVFKRLHSLAAISRCTGGG